MDARHSDPRRLDGSTARLQGRVTTEPCRTSQGMVKCLLFEVIPQRLRDWLALSESMDDVTHFSQDY